MDSSILNMIKSMIGYESDYDPFDSELIVLINGNLRKLNQLGVGKQNFVITGPDETWDEFLGENLNLFADAKTYVFMKTRLIHDPPQNSFIVSAYKDEVSEIEWRLNVDHETPLEVDSNG